MAAEDKYIEVETVVSTTATAISIVSTYINNIWILAYGLWNDDGIWVDDETWND